MVSLPQLISIVRTRKTEGIALPNWQNMLGVVTAWSFHGWRTGAPQLVFSNVLLVVGAFLIVLLISRARGLRFPRTWLQPMIIASVGIAIDVTVGAAIFGLMIVLPTVYGHIASAREMLRSASVAGVAPLYFVLNGIVQVLWLLYGLGAGDSALIVACILNGSLSFTNVVIYSIRAHKISIRSNTDADAQHVELVGA